MLAEDGAYLQRFRVDGVLAGRVGAGHTEGWGNPEARDLT